MTSNQKFALRQSMHIYVKNISTKFYTDPTRNDGTLGFFEVVAATTTMTSTTR